MVTCFVCKDCTFCNVRSLFKHLKDVHFLYKRHAKYVCCESQCSRMFDDKYTFSRHITQQHPESISDDVTPVAQSTNVPTTPEQASSSTVVHKDSDDSDSAVEQPSNARKLLKDIAAKCLAEIKSGTGTLQQAQLMTKVSTDIVNFIMEDIAGDIESFASVCQTDEQRAAMTALHAKVESYCKPFEGLETEHSFKDTSKKVVIMLVQSNMSLDDELPQS